MTRSKSIAATTAIYAAVVGREGRAVQANHNNKRLNDSRQASSSIDERKLNAPLHYHGKNIRKSNAGRKRRQTETTNHVGIAQYESMAQFEPIYQASAYVDSVMIESKSGKAKGKSVKDDHNHVRPQEHLQSLQQAPPQHASSNEYESTTDEIVDDTIFTWSQSDVAQDLQAGNDPFEHQQIIVMPHQTAQVDTETSDFITSPLSPQDIILLQHENEFGDDDDTGAFIWSEDDTWINDGHDDNYHNEPFLDGKASKLFKYGVHHGGKSGKGSKTGGGSPIWGGSDSISPSAKVPTPQAPSTSQPVGSDTPPTPTPSPFQSILPPLTWAGVDNCSLFYPCAVCTGDCDRDSDCQTGLKCFKREEGESTPVLGCASGGPGDIPGADFCFDPSGMSGRPTSGPSSGSERPTSSVSLMPAESKSPSSSDLPPLEFVGVTGCTITSPCDLCKGDCDSDLECRGTLKCFKRADGAKNQVPGCAVGGKGDIAGADYCYDENSDVGSSSPSKSPIKGGVEPTKPPLITFPTMSPNATSPSAKPSKKVTSTTVPSISLPSRSSVPSIFVMPPESEMPSVETTTKYLIRSRSRPDEDWCISGALSPDYYQLMLATCIADTTDPQASTPIRRIEQMDQLWTMDSVGLLHSVYDYGRCMTVQSDPSVLDEVGIEIGPCDSNSTLQKFVYDESKATLTLQGDAYSTYCVTYLGETVNKGSPIILEQCESKEKFGWDVIPEEIYGQPSPSPTVIFPFLKYNGRDACTPDSPCDTCTGDCDKDSDCEAGLLCFQRAKDETSQVPGCEVGGAQDIPGADYCYDPGSPWPPLVWLGEVSSGCSKSNPCNRCTGACTTDTDCVGNLKCFQREQDANALIPGCRGGGEDDVIGGHYCYDPNAEPHPSIKPSRLPSSLVSLRWRGSDGCSPDNPCPICTGDCDDANDCDTSLECYKRYAGDRSQVPGCEVGGLGDIPGGDYCYDPQSASGHESTMSPNDSL